MFGLERFSSKQKQPPTHQEVADWAACGGEKQANYIKDLLSEAQKQMQSSNPLVMVGETFTYEVKETADTLIIQEDPIGFLIGLKLLMPRYGLSCDPASIIGNTITFTRIA